MFLIREFGKKEMEINSLIEKKEKEIHQICEKGHGFLVRNYYGENKNEC